MPPVKERLETIENEQGQVERAVMVDVNKRKEEDRVPPDVKNWMRKLEEAPQINQQSLGGKGQSPAGATDDQKIKTKLPTTRKTFVAGFSQAVNSAGKWFSETILRMIKIKKGEVEFKQDDD